MHEPDSPEVYAADVPLRKPADRSGMGIEGMGSRTGTDAGGDRKPKKSGTNQEKGNGAGYRPEKEGLTMIVIGYPTTAAMMDAYERNMERRWEQLNAPDPAESRMQDAAESLEAALHNIDSGLDWISDAVSKLGDYPMADKVQSFLNDFEELANQLETLKDHYERGERG
jgi:hypothetical protein